MKRKMDETIYREKGMVVLYLNDFGSVISEAGVVLGQEVFEVGESLLLKGVKATPSSLRRGLPLYP